MAETQTKVMFDTYSVSLCCI